MDKQIAIDALQKRASRRSFMAKTGMFSAAVLGAGLMNYKPSVAAAAETAKFQSGKKKISVNDTDILNFALNLEYLEAEYYLRAATGSGLQDADVTGIVGDESNKKDQGTPGTVTGGTQVSFTTPLIQDFAQELATDEQNHVLFLRAALGADAVARPDIDFTTAFTTAATAAGVITAGETFNPFDNEDDFLLGAFLFEDVGVTAYHGGAPYIKNSDYLSAAAGILGTEAYHAGAIRALLLQTAGVPSVTVSPIVTATNLIAAKRAQLDGTNSDDIGITDSKGGPAFLDGDSNSITYARTFQQVLNIVYLGATAAPFGFFPNKMNGVIQ